HVMAEAIQDVIGKEVQLAYGPPTETGFFYDMFVPGRPITAGDFERINARMGEIIKEDRAFSRYELDAAAGMEKLEEEGNKYKADNAARAMAAADKASSGPVNKSGYQSISVKLLGGTTVQCPPAARLSFYATGTPGKNWE